MIKHKHLKIAVIGASGAVGLELLRCLERRSRYLKEIFLFSSASSAGGKLLFKNQLTDINVVTDECFKNIDIAFFATNESTSLQYCPIAVQNGCMVIDNSSAFRMDPNVPLIVPEININDIKLHKGIIAVPNCLTIIATLPLWQIYKKNKIKRIIISTYQSASGAGLDAMNELIESTKAYIEGREYKNNILPHPYAFNIFSHNSLIDETTLYNQEELKIIKETKKLFQDEDISITATCIRVPVLRSHSAAITFECESAITPNVVREILSNSTGVKIIDRWQENYFPMPYEATNNLDILVGRIRQDLGDCTGKTISMFVSGDQLLKGAALNAVQIAEHLLL